MNQLSIILRSSGLALGLMLSACGGGSGDGLASTPSPTPTQTPPSYTRISDLTGDQSFNTTGVGGSVNSSNVLGHETSFSYSSSVKITFNTTNNIYSVSGLRVQDNFVQGDIRPSGDPKTVYLEKSDPSTGALLAWTRLITPSPAGIDFSYTRLAAWMTTRDPQTAGRPRVLFLVGGVQTLANDVPSSGTATFTKSAAIGDAFEYSSGKSYDLKGSSATLTADFGANTVTTSLTLLGTPYSDPQASRPLGTYSGTGTIGANGQPRNVFNGVFSAPNPSLAGFSGAFFGPQASEYGYNFSISDSSINAAGTVAGGR